MKKKKDLKNIATTPENEVVEVKNTDAQTTSEDVSDVKNDDVTATTLQKDVAEVETTQNDEVVEDCDNAQNDVAAQEENCQDCGENVTDDALDVAEDNDKPKKKKSFGEAFVNVFKTLGSWIGRAFWGASKTLVKKKKTKDEGNEDDKKKFAVEEIDSPTKQMVKNFFRRPSAVIALCVLVFMFLFAFIGSASMTTYSDESRTPTHKNIEPNYSMLSVKGGMKNDVLDISSRSFFTFGLDQDGNMYHWGVTKMNASGVDVGDIPKEIKGKKLAFIAAGTDHVVAIGDDGMVYAWGYNTLGQYIKDESDLEEQSANAGIILMPEALRFGGKVDVDNIKKVVCGSQATAILMKDGTLHIWGNAKTYTNMSKFVGKKFSDIAFTLTQVVGVLEDGSALYTGSTGVFDKLKTDYTSTAIDQEVRLRGRKIIDMAVTDSNVAVLLDDNSILFSGSFVFDNQVDKPKLDRGDYFVQIEAGGNHYVGLTKNGKVYAWGDNTFGQCDISGKTADKVFAGAYQSYAVNENGKLVASSGLKGYLFGTDGNGMDVFKRIISGGRMTLTIGAVAVIISTIIGIIVGCVSGYFGGWVDMLLMRITEIVAAIPFLPFAMILSALISSGAFGEVSETTRIAVIMCILGFLSWTGLARLVRGQVLAARENEYVTAAKAMGVREGKIAFKHILPNVMSVIVVTLTLDFAGCMLTESSLSYLGFGVQYPRPTWGNMLNATTTLTVIGNFWWQWVFPGLFLAITTISINIIGDTLRDIMDPKSGSER